MTYDFDGRHVVVTGGTGVLGAAVTRQLLEAGATCHIPAIDQDEVSRFELASHDRVHITQDVDLTSEDAVSHYYRELPGLWASIHCAGGFSGGAVTDTSLADLQRLLSINVVTSFLCTREAVAKIRDSAGDGGRIVNISAQPGIEPRNAGGLSAYAAAKGGVATFSLAVADEVGPEGIWVNAVVPSIIDTPTNRADMPNADHDAWPTPEEIAATVVFLAAPENRLTRAGLVPVYGRS